MNNNLIEKIIKTSQKSCPTFQYENPIIDKKVARALSKSFIEILKLCKPSNTNTTLDPRVLVLTSIKKICRIEPTDHIKLDENIINLLSDSYLQFLDEPNNIDEIDKELDEFLIRTYIDQDICSKFEIQISQDTVQALVNLNKNNVTEYILKNIVHLKTSNKLYLFSNLWDTNSIPSVFDDISIKIKPEIENILLETSYRILNNTELNIEDEFKPDTELTRLISKCYTSSCCFQMCISILNFLLIKTEYNLRIENLISKFIFIIKSNCTGTISILYPKYLSHIVLLMDMDTETLPESLKCNYHKKVTELLQKESENDMIMLLSHFPYWFYKLISYGST